MERFVVQNPYTSWQTLDYCHKTIAELTIRVKNIAKHNKNMSFYKFYAVFTGLYRFLICLVDSKTTNYIIKHAKSIEVARPRGLRGRGRFCL